MMIDISTVEVGCNEKRKWLMNAYFIGMMRVCCVVCVVCVV